MSDISTRSKVVLLAVVGVVDTGALGGIAHTSSVVLVYYLGVV